MTVSGLWPDLASLGLGVLAAALGAWYVVADQLERQRRSMTEKWFTGRRPVGPSALSHTLAELSAPRTAVEPTGAEEILAASPGPVADGLFGAGADLVAGTLSVTGGHRWIQLAATACVGLLLTCLAVALGLPLLLVMVLAYVTDSGHDFRLRIIVGLFLVDIALQTIAHL